MFALAHSFIDNFFPPVILKLGWRSECDKASSHCGNGKHKLMTVCPQQLLQMFPLHSRGCLWGWPTSHIGLRVPAGKALPYCYWVPWKRIFTTSFCDFGQCWKILITRNFSHWSFYLVLFSILTWCWISSIFQVEVRSWRPRQHTVCKGASMGEYDIWILIPALFHGGLPSRAISSVTTMLMWVPVLLQNPEYPVFQQRTTWLSKGNSQWQYNR